MANTRAIYTTHDSTHDIHNYQIDVPGRQIFLMGEPGAGVDDDEGSDGEPGIEYRMASRFIRNMHIMLQRGKKPITIHMKTCGGDWREGLAIYDTIRLSPCKVSLLSYTHARSMSSIIIQAAHRRVMMPNSVFMFHDGTMAYSGTTKQFLNEADELAKSAGVMAGIYAERMRAAPYWNKKSDSFIKAWLREQMDAREDVYLNPDEAIKYGLADAVLGRKGLDFNTLAKGL